MMDVAGSCLCGRIKIQLSEISPEITICHCQMCQKFHGGPFLSLAACTSEQITIDNQTLIQRYDSSEWAQRGFCRNCGSSLFYFLHETEEYFFATGLFSVLPEAVLVEELYTKDQPHFYHFAETTKRWSTLPQEY
jgi:hypothetical protein